MASLRRVGVFRRVAAPLLVAVCVLLPGCPPPNGTTDPADEPVPVAIYWAHYDEITSTGLTFVSPDAGTAGGIAVDPVAQKVYWTDREAGGAGNGGVRVAGLDGSNPETLLSGLKEPGFITLDPAGGKMYWIALDAGGTEGRIQRANLDGTSFEPDYLPIVNRPTGVVLVPGDPATLYFAWLYPLSGNYEIWSAPVDAPGTAGAFLTGLAETGALDAGGGWIYWTTTAGHIYRVPDYGGPETVECVLADVALLEDVAIDLPNRDVYVCTAGLLDHEDMTNTIYPSVFVAPLDGAPSPIRFRSDSTFPSAEHTDVIALYWPPE